MSDRPLTVAFYYGGPREPNDQTNPYGNLLADGLAARGVAVTFETRFDEAFFEENAGLIDVLHLHWPSHEYNRPDRLETETLMHQLVRRLEHARKLGYRIVWTAHNLYPHDRTHHQANREFRFALCRLVTAIISHCDLAADAVRAEFHPEAPIFVIPHGNFIGVLEPSISREEARASAGRGIPAGDFVYGFIGNLLPYKGLEELIAAFREIDSPDAWLVLAGGCRPSYGEEIRALVAGHPRIDLRTFDYAPGVEFVRVLQASDVIVLPFRASTTSGSLVQALSWGRPAIVPAMGCLPTQLDPSAGIAYSPTEPDALRLAMEEIRRWDLAAAGRAAFESSARLSWDVIAERTIEAYRA